MECSGPPSISTPWAKFSSPNLVERSSPHHPRFNKILINAFKTNQILKTSILLNLIQCGLMMIEQMAPGHTHCTSVLEQRPHPMLRAGRSRWGLCSRTEVQWARAWGHPLNQHQTIFFS